MFHHRGKTLTRVSEENRAKGEEYRVRGERLFSAAEYDMANACFSKAIAYNEYDWASWWGRAKCKLENARFFGDESYRSDVRRALELAPEGAQAEIRRAYDGYLALLRECAGEES